MPSNHNLRRCQNAYAKLLRLYPRPHRERFGEEMLRTFNDLARDHLNSNKGLPGFLLWIFTETFTGIMKENITNITTHYKSITRVAFGTALILMIPLLGNAPWDETDFIVAGALLMGTGLAYEFIARKGRALAYRVAAGIAVLTALFLIWANLAVGIIGNEENPANLMFNAVILVGIVGAFISGLRPQGMARTLFSMAIAQALVPVIAMIIWNPPITPGLMRTFAANAFFIALWAASALLFRRARPTDPI